MSRGGVLTGLSFYKQLKFGPFSLNLSKSGASLGVGVKGFRLTGGPRGLFLNLGFMGLRYRRKLDLKKAAFSQEPGIAYWLKAGTDGRLMHPDGIIGMEQALMKAVEVAQKDDSDDVYVIAESLKSLPEAFWRVYNRGGRIGIDDHPVEPAWLNPKPPAAAETPPESGPTTPDTGLMQTALATPEAKAPTPAPKKRARKPRK